MISFLQLKESLATDQANRLGLSYLGFGRWGENGKVTHLSKFGRLVPLEQVTGMRTLHNDELKHLEHTDDEVFNHGVKGVINSIEQFNSLRHGDNNTIISQKIDGCVHADTIIMTNNGEKKISELNFTDTSVLAKDLNSNLDIMTDITNYTNLVGEKNWIELTLENGSILKLTEDHEVYTINRGWVEAKDLTITDDTLTILDNTLTIPDDIMEI
jgi:hypothetical protein